MMALLLVLASGGALAGENRLHWVEVELRGPLEEVCFDCGHDGATRLRARLAPGEELEVLVPLPLRDPVVNGDPSLRPRPRIQVLGAGRVILGALVPDSAQARFERLPPGLRARSRPPVGPGGAHARAPELLLVVAAFLLARSRSRLFLVAGSSLACILVFVLASRRIPGSAAYRVVEIDVESPAWFEVEASAGTLSLPRERLEVEPAHATVQFELELRAGEVRGIARSPGSRLYGILLGTGAIPTRGRNDGRDFEGAWSRDADGGWRDHGAWKRGVPLPEASPARILPPGWLLAGLPPGRGVFLGVTEDGSWVRVTGF